MTFRIAALCAGLLLGSTALATAQTPNSTNTPVDTRKGAFFTVNGDTLFYQTRGSGPAMLLVHGFPLSGALFGPERFGLAQKFTVITVDLPGFGMSTTGTTQQTDATYATDMVALLAHLGISKAIIGGHSMGGQIVLQMYQQAPTLFAGMILFDTNPTPASLIEKGEWPGFAQQAAAHGTISLAPAIEPVMVDGTYLAAHPAAMATLRQIVQEATPAGVAGGANALISRPNFEPALNAIVVPTLVVEGADDTVYGQPVAQALKAAIPGAQILIVPGAGHASMFQKPDITNAGIVEWATASGLL